MIEFRYAIQRAIGKRVISSQYFVIYDAKTVN